MNRWRKPPEKIQARTKEPGEILDFWHTKKQSIKQLFSEASELLEKPFSFIKDPEFLRKDHEIVCIVNKETLTREIVEKRFQSVQLGPVDTTNPSQLQNTVWFQLLRLEICGKLCRSDWRTRRVLNFFNLMQNALDFIQT